MSEADAARLADEVKARALDLGFARVGVARAEALEPEGDRLRAWLRAGRHGSMAWMADTAEVRADPRHPGMLGEARSVVVLVAPYARRDALVGPPPTRVAAYARGRDYHNLLGKRARKLAASLRDRGYAARAGVDALPIFERAWAARAGVGFIGKNCCLIVPGLGSHVLLGAVVTDAELAPDPSMRPRCGSCRLCLEGCPTGAFARPRELDARRCVSYLTIEHEGPIPEPLRPGVGPWILGCDACQDVCPYNRTSPPPPETTAPFAADPERWDRDAAEFLRMDEDAFDRISRGSPMRRPGLAGMARNAAVALGNAGDRRHLPVLRDAATHHPDATVRDAAAWGAARLGARVSLAPR